MSTQNSPKIGVEPRRRLSAGKNSDIPFYETPVGVPTSSQIIKEAKEKLHDAKRNNLAYVPEANGLVRTLSSQRPFTPREDKRTLFGPKSSRAVNERPPSSFYISSKSFETDPGSSRPHSATRLSPIEKVFCRFLEQLSQKKNSSHLIDFTQLNLKPSSAKLNTSYSQSLHENEATTSQNFDEQNNSHNNVLSLTSPKSIKSRLAPLDVPALNKLPARSETKKNASKEHNSDKQSRTSEKDDDCKLEQEWKTTIEPLIETMNQTFKDANRTDLFCELCEKLNKLLEQNQLFNSKTCSTRSLILKQLFKYLDTNSDRIKIRVSNIILNMKVTGNNLTNIFRLLFSVSKNTESDVHFIENEIIDSLLSSSKRLNFKDNSDSVIYFCGTIKNLSENNKLLKKLSSKNVEEVLVKLIRELSKHYKENENMKVEAGHALVQLTATLRNLADLNNTRNKFLSLKLIEHLVYILKYYTSDSELMLNVSRILSKLTLHSDCCNQLILQDSCYKSFIKIMIKHDSKQDLIVRIGFILGNITARHENARAKFFQEKYSIDTLINTLKLYFTNDMQKTKKESVLSNQNATNLNDISENEEPNPNEDCMIKLIRVIANLAINERGGVLLANRQDLFDILLQILETKDLSKEELIIDSIVTINNISFYSSDLIVNYSQKIIDCLIKYLLSTNVDAVLEVFRVVANLSRDPSVRSYLVYRRINILTIAYLNSPSRELVYIVIGVLINLMTDADNRLVLKQEKAIKKLIEILNESGPSDWQLSAMICKLLMNYSEKPRANGSKFIYFESDELGVLKVILKELLDEKFAWRSGKDDRFESSCSNNEENINEYMNCLWKQDFCPVGSLLLKRLTDEFSN